MVFAIVHLALLDRCQRCVQTGPLMAPCASWSWLLQVAFRVCPRLDWDSSWLRKFLGFNPSNKLKSWEKQLTILTTSLLRYGFWISMKLIDISICMHRWYKVISSCIYICMIPARSHCSILSWGGDFDDRAFYRAVPGCALASKTWPCQPVVKPKVCHISRQWPKRKAKQFWFEHVWTCKFNIYIYNLILHFTRRINKCVA